jgi:sugar/nucleoside kinase (ribokinase family)
MIASCDGAFPKKQASKALAAVVVGGGAGFTVGLALNLLNDRSVHLSLYIRRKSI